MTFFSKNPRREVHGTATPLPGTIKSDLLPGAKKRWFEAFIAPLLETSRVYRFTVFVCLIALIEAGALYRLIPLHERVPYLADWTEDGQLREVGQFKRLTPENVQQVQVNYHAKTWAKRLLTIGSQTKTNLEAAASWVRGAGVNELNEWLETDRPGERLASNPDYTRTIEKEIVVTNGQGKTLFLHIELVERNKGVITGRPKKILQIDYDLVPQMMNDRDNPIGLAIIHFMVGDE
ncbi:type IV secretory pathway, component VirB8 [Azospira oryzae PS]|uniref:Type IV secretory pathway, component VirB8 n=1 Tax=Azospira oryzae (strain ATCC BAA-33 / DSM 13638 / PS) TaxID=640081 RepID=G8QNP2_AZOOP|nr:VirB8/TrbF family protein [Azospira oryzae]AEV26936.1 type IV secretory pathway, component VirB8 [Azospira oryzae PS]